MRKKFLLGATKDGELVFGEFEIININRHSEFTARFDIVRPFNEKDVDLVDYFDDFAGNYGKEYAYDLCERYHCAPQDLAQELADECNDPRDALDCSLYPEEIEIDGDFWYFESESCGQHDTRKEMDEYVNKEAYDLLHELWDLYHLKNISEINDFVRVKESIEYIKKALDVDEKEWIKDYIERNF